MRLHVSGKSAAGVFHSANFHVDLESNFLIGHYWFSCILFIQEIQPDTKQVSLIDGSVGSEVVLQPLDC